MSHSNHILQKSIPLSVYHRFMSRVDDLAALFRYNHGGDYTCHVAEVVSSTSSDQGSAIDCMMAAAGVGSSCRPLHEPCSVPGGILFALARCPLMTILTAFVAPQAHHPVGGFAPAVDRSSRHFSSTRQSSHMRLLLWSLARACTCTCLAVTGGLYPIWVPPFGMSWTARFASYERSAPGAGLACILNLPILNALLWGVPARQSTTGARKWL